MTLKPNERYWTVEFERFYRQTFLQQKYGFWGIRGRLPLELGGGDRCWGCRREMITRAPACGRCHEDLRDWIFRLYAGAVADYGLSPTYGIKKTEDYVPKALGIIEKYFRERWSVVKEWRRSFRKFRPATGIPDYIQVDETGDVTPCWYSGKLIVKEETEEEFWRKIQEVELPEKRLVKLVSIQRVTREGVILEEWTPDPPKEEPEWEGGEDPVEEVEEPDTDPALECRMPDLEDGSVQMAVGTDLTSVPDETVEKEPAELVRKFSPGFLKMLKMNNTDKLIEMPGGRAARGSHTWLDRLAFIMRGNPGMFRRLRSNIHPG